MRYAISICLILVGIIHLLPLAGVLGPERLATLYGLNFDETNLAILMRHRALLFGLLGALLVAAGFIRQLQPVALIAGLVSVLGFLWLAWASGGNYNEAIAKVVFADIIATALLLIAAIALFLQRRRS